jgi:COP9 signalosome complex subunit 6
MSAPSDAAAASAAPAPAPTTAAASSSGGFTFKLHPLVIVNVSDHHTRVKAQAACSADSSSPSSGPGAGQPPRVFGCVIGVQRGRTVEIFNSFELVLDPVSGTLDRAFLEKKQELCKLLRESAGSLLRFHLSRRLKSYGMLGFRGRFGDAVLCYDCGYADKKVFPDFYVLGWYSTGSDVHDTDMQIHKAVSFYNRFFKCLNLSFV